MTQIPFDQLAKQFLEEVLEPFGEVQRNFEVPGESKYVDVWFTPNPVSPSLPNLGVLNRIASTACLLEPFRTPPSRTDVRTCQLKLLWLHEAMRRKAAQEHRTLSESELPRLWILATSVSKPLLADFGATQRDNELPGLYFLPEAQKTVIVSIDELPVSRDTLNLRLLGRGETQQQAIGEVRSLPSGNPQREQILRILANWKVTIELSRELEPDDQEVLMALSQPFLEWEQATEERGVYSGKVSLILAQLRNRLGELPFVLSNEIQSLSSQQLDALAIALLNITSQAELEQWLVLNRTP